MEEKVIYFDWLTDRPTKHHSREWVSKFIIGHSSHTKIWFVVRFVFNCIWRPQKQQRRRYTNTYRYRQRRGTKKRNRERRMVEIPSHTVNSIWWIPVETFQFCEIRRIVKNVNSTINFLAVACYGIQTLPIEMSLKANFLKKTMSKTFAWWQFTKKANENEREKKNRRKTKRMWATGKPPNRVGAE